MAGNLGGITDLTGIRLGGGEAIPGVTSSAASPGSSQVWQSFRTYAMPTISLTANGSTTTVAAFPGAKAGDFARAALASSASSGAGVGTAWVSADNSVTVAFSNSSTAALAIALQTLQVVVERYGV